MTEGGRSLRYSALAIVLHWLIAAAIVLQLMLGWRLDDLEGAARTAVLQLHKSVGITILLLSLARWAWRFAKPPPPEPAELAPWEKRLSAYVHTGFYVLMIGLPLTGWAMISSTRVGAGTRLFGLVPWPKIPILPILPAGLQNLVADLFGTTHALLVWVILALLALHILGALKHHLISQDAVLPRMIPGAKPGRLLEPRLLAIVLVALAATALAYLPRPDPAAVRPPVRTIASADLYLDVVQPALTRRCQSCHNEDRARGGLSVVRYEDLMLGGEGGAVIKPRDPAKSDLYRRITLPGGHKDYMPADGKTPLNADQIKLVQWWIAVGAPRSARVGDLKPADDLTAALTKVLRLGEGASGPGEKLPVVPAGDPQVISALEASGYIVRPVSVTSNLLEVNRYLRTPPSEADLANLVRLRQQVWRLILRDVSLGDGALDAIGQLQNLISLRIESNPITDAGLAKLGGLTRLRVLNLYGSKVTDAGIAAIQTLPALQSVHLWGTGVTEAGVMRLRAARPGLTVTLEAAPAAGPAAVPAPPV